MRLLSLSIILLLLSLSFASAVSTSYYYVGSKLVASKGLDGFDYVVQDRLGSNRVNFGIDGEVIARYLSLPFGQTIQSGGERFEFTGKESDSSGLHYFGARYYNADIGRFTSVDAVVSEEPYQYVGNMPLNYVDPDGTTKTLAVVMPVHSDFLVSDIEQLLSYQKDHDVNLEIIFVQDVKNPSLMDRRGVLDGIPYTLIRAKPQNVMLALDSKRKRGDFDEAIISSHGLTKKDGFETLEPGMADTISPIKLTWEEFAQRDWLFDYSCGSTCPTDKYSRSDGFTNRLSTTSKFMLRIFGLYNEDGLARDEDTLEGFFEERYNIKSQVIDYHLGVEIDYGPDMADQYNPDNYPEINIPSSSRNEIPQS